MRVASLAALALLALAPLSLSAATGKPAPSFKLKDVNGKAWDLQPHLGNKVVVVNFFATWCAPCQAELPMLQRLHEKYAEQGLEVVVVSIDDPKSVAKVKPLVREQKYTFDVLLDTQTKVVSIYNPKKVVPFTSVIDKSGNLHAEKFGFQPGDEEKFEKELQTLLGLAEPAATAEATPAATPESTPAATP